MVRRVENASPKDPDALTLHVEKGNDHMPPFVRLFREKLQPLRRQFDESVAIRVHGQLFGQNAGGRGLRSGKKFPEEPAFREKLVLEYLGDRRRAGMRFVI